MEKQIRRIENNRILSVLLNREVFTTVYLTVCILLSLPLLGFVMDPVSKVCFVWGVGLLGWDLISHRRMFRGFYWVIPILMLFFYGCSVLLNRDVLVSGAKHFIHTAISLLLIFGVNREATVAELKRLLCRICDIVISLASVTGLAALITFLFRIKFRVNRLEFHYKQGFCDNRLFGVFSSANSNALFCLLGLVAVVILWFLCRERVKKLAWLYGLFAVLQVICFSLTLSKGGFLSMVAFAAVFAVCYVWPRFWKSSGKRVLSLLLALLCLAVFIGGSYGVIQLARKGMVALNNGIHTAVSGKPGEVSEEITSERIESGDDISNNRFTIWLGGLKVSAQSPVLGWADGKVTAETVSHRFDTTSLTEKERGWLTRHNGYYHNSYVQLMVYSGGIGLVLFLVLALLTARRIGFTLLRTRKCTPTYSVIAVLFSLCALFLANGVVESHLLFNRQDPFGILFWFAAGVALALAERYENDPESALKPETSTTALLAATPLQVMYCVALAQEETGTADLYVAHPFGGSAAVAQRLRESGIFSAVYDLDAKGKNGRWTTFYRAFFPRQALVTASGKTVKPTEKRYTRVLASSQTSLSIGLRRSFPFADSQMFDDGVGSYFGSMVRDYNSGLFTKLNTVFFDGGLNLDPSVLYLTYPALYRGSTAAAVCQLPPLGTEARSQLETVFGYAENPVYTERKLVYLTQPLEEKPGYRPEREQALRDRLQTEYADRTVLRVHPRQAAADFGGLVRDTVGNLWELECLKQITDKHLLMGGFSTAQLMPKLLTDAEPFVIFTYKLLMEDVSDTSWQEISRLIDSFRSLYRHPERIAIPENESELESALKQWVEMV